jgi:peptidoglycan hydrolase-like protein with peptidoglycan-binding domain
MGSYYYYSHANILRFFLFLICIGSIFLGYIFLKEIHNASGYTGDFASEIASVTNTQAVLTYTSPVSGACQVEVSESASFSPVVHDVDSTLFTGANQDTRNTALSNGRTRVFVVGKRTSEQALDGNYYSRALQTYLTHYYKVTCGTQISQGSFQTKTIPTGLTYSDTIPGNTLGVRTWPTITNNRNQVIIDPQTGLKITRISLVNDYTTSTGLAYPDYLTFGASASTDVCNSTLVADNTSAMGYHCIMNNVLFWVNPLTGEGRPVGMPASLYNGVDFGAFTPCGAIDTQDPNVIYCTPLDSTGKSVLIKLLYEGNNTFLNKELPLCTGSNQPCVTRTVLTPSTGNNDLNNLVHNFDTEYPTNFNVNDYAPEIKSIQNGKIFMQVMKSIQDSYAWHFVFDPGNGLPVGSLGSTAGIVAAMSTYKHYPIRWCSSHGITPIGNVDWVLSGSNYLSGGSSQPGFGLYTNNIVAGSLSASTTTCPINVFGDTQCTSIVVDGEPCDENESPQNANAKCGVSSSSYLQDAEVGDLFGIEPNPSRGRLYKEFVRLIQKTGNTWIVARGINQTPIVAHATGVLDAACTAHDTAQAEYDKGVWFWDYVHDPHGTGTPGTTIVFDRNATGGHAGYRPNKMLEITYPPTYKVRSGTVPNFIDESSITLDDANPSFASVQGIGYPNTVDSHPTPFYNNTFALDGRPMNSGITYLSSATSLGSGVYKYSAGAVSLYRKKLATIAYSGSHILTDISSSTSNISSSLDYSYCVVENAGECLSGSLPTEVYVKSTTASTATCPFPGIALDGWAQEHICIGDNSMYNQAIAQIGPTVQANGKNGRMLTHGLTTYNRQDVYWNVRALPDASGMLFTLPKHAVYGEGSGQVFYAKLPPFTIDSTIRDDFANVPITVPAPQNLSSVSASILFGYSEYGGPDQYYCTSRKEACIKGRQSGTQYDFGSTTTSRVSCASGCTISIPLIPGRIAYVQVQYHDSGGSVIEQNTPQVVISEDPYTVVSLPYAGSVSSGQSGGGGNSGGGAGGGSTAPSPVIGNGPIVPQASVSMVAPVIAQVLAAPVVTNLPVPVYTPPVVPEKLFQPLRTLVLNAKGNDVLLLQELLRKRPDIYPEGLVTGYYGPLTKRAVQKFQDIYKITRPTIYGYGFVGPLTTNRINTVFSQSTVNTKIPQQTESEYSDVVQFALTSEGQDVVLIQQYLSISPDIYPEGLVTGYYGPATKRAVERFQTLHRIVKKNSPSYGVVGPVTFEKLRSVFYSVTTR